MSLSMAGSIDQCAILCVRRRIDPWRYRIRRRDRDEDIIRLKENGSDGANPPPFRNGGWAHKADLVAAVGTASFHVASRGGGGNSVVSSVA